jgi:hypothetical protein
MQRPEDPSGRPITEYRTINEPLVPFTTAGSFVWVHAFSRVGRDAPVRTEPLPFRRAVACLGQAYRVRFIRLNERGLSCPSNIALLRNLTLPAEWKMQTQVRTR